MNANTKKIKDMSTEELNKKFGFFGFLFSNGKPYFFESAKFIMNVKEMASDPKYIASLKKEVLAILGWVKEFLGKNNFIGFDIDTLREFVRLINCEWTYSSCYESGSEIEEYSNLLRDIYIDAKNLDLKDSEAFAKHFIDKIKPSVLKPDDIKTFFLLCNTKVIGRFDKETFEVFKDYALASGKIDANLALIMIGLADDDVLDMTEVVNSFIDKLEINDKDGKVNPEYLSGVIDKFIVQYSQWHFGSSKESKHEKEAYLLVRLINRLAELGCSNLLDKNITRPEEESDRGGYKKTYSELATKAIEAAKNKKDEQKKAQDANSKNKSEVPEVQESLSHYDNVESIQSEIKGKIEDVSAKNKTNVIGEPQNFETASRDPSNIDVKIKKDINNNISSNTSSDFDVSAYSPENTKALNNYLAKLSDMETKNFIAEQLDKVGEAFNSNESLESIKNRLLNIAYVLYVLGHITLNKGEKLDDHLIVRRINNAHDVKFLKSVFEVFNDDYGIVINNFCFYECNEENTEALMKYLEIANDDEKRKLANRMLNQIEISLKNSDKSLRSIKNEFVNIIDVVADLNNIDLDKKQFLTKKVNKASDVALLKKIFVILKNIVGLIFGDVTIEKIEAELAKNNLKYVFDEVKNTKRKREREIDRFIKLKSGSNVKINKNVER